MDIHLWSFPYFVNIPRSKVENSRYKINYMMYFILECEAVKKMSTRDLKI